MTIGISSLDSAGPVHPHILYVHRRSPSTDRGWHIVRHRHEQTKTFLFPSDSRLGGSWLKLETLPMSLHENLCSLQQTAVTLLTSVSTSSPHLSTFAHLIHHLSIIIKQKKKTCILHVNINETHQLMWNCRKRIIRRIIFILICY